MAVISANLGFRLVHRQRSRVLLIASILVWFHPVDLKAQATSQSTIEPATASRSADYDKLLDRAVEAFDDKDYLKAREYFEQAYVIRPNARVLRGLGISALHLERFGVAKRELTEALREQEQPLTSTQREGVAELLSWMRVNLGTLQLLLDPIDAAVALDHKPVVETHLVLKPGAHHVRVSFAGLVAQEHTVQVAAGGDHTLRVTLAPAADAAEGTPAVSAAHAAEAAAASSTSRSSQSPFAATDRAEPERESSSVLESWWFWTAIGVVVVGGVATGIALAAPAPEKAHETGGLGGVIMPLGRAP